MKCYIDKLAIMAIIVTAGACSKPVQTEDKVAMVVGTYTGTGSHGVYSLLFDQSTGSFTMIDSLEAVNPSYLVFSADSTKIYTVNELDSDGAGVSAVSFDRHIGEFSPVNGESTESGAPCYIATNGRMVVTANYSGGSVSVFPLNPDGSLMPLDTIYYGSVGGPDSTRQELPHVHCVEFSPDGKYLFASDFSADRLLSFKVSDDGTHLLPLLDADGQQVTVAVEADYGPRHLIFDKDSRHGYVIGELSGKITVFDYEDGKLVQKQVVDADPYDGRGSADIHLSPDGRFLYASNRLKGDGISIFSVDPQSGMLTEAGYRLTGPHPRHFNITPNGKYLLVACRDSNEIEIYAIDESTGMLTPTGESIALPSPVCVQFMR